MGVCYPWYLSCIQFPRSLKTTFLEASSQVPGFVVYRRFKIHPRDNYLWWCYLPGIDTLRWLDLILRNTAVIIINFTGNVVYVNDIGCELPYINIHSNQIKIYSEVIVKKKIDARINIANILIQITSLFFKKVKKKRNGAFTFLYS